MATSFYRQVKEAESGKEQKSGRLMRNNKSILVGSFLLLFHVNAIPPYYSAIT